MDCDERIGELAQRDRRVRRAGRALQPVRAEPDQACAGLLLAQAALGIAGKPARHLLVRSFVRSSHSLPARAAHARGAEAIT